MRINKLLVTLVILLSTSSAFADVFPIRYEDCKKNKAGQVILTGWFSEVRMTGQHKAIDIPCPIGTQIRAVRAGKVVFKGWEGPVPGKQSYGIYIVIKESPKRFRYYCHLNSYNIKLYEDVKEGDIIAESGTTGMSYFSPHLHSEMRNDIGEKVNVTFELSDTIRRFVLRSNEYCFDLR